MWLLRQNDSEREITVAERGIWDLITKNVMLRNLRAFLITFESETLLFEAIGGTQSE